MFTRNFFFIVLFAFLPILFFSCKENPENPSGTQLQQIIAELEKDGNFSAFTSALKNLNIEDEEITVLAFSNDNNQTSVTNEIITRHIISGAYTTNEFKKITAIKALNGQYLSVDADENGEIRINGIKLAEEKIIGKSVVFHIEKMISDDIIPIKEIVFEVWECNQNILPEYPHEAVLSKNATINIYKDNKLYITLNTNEEGRVSFKVGKGQKYFYKVIKNDLSDIYFNYKVNGVFMTQEEVDNYPVYHNNFIKAIGELKLADINGDGIVDEIDKIDFCEIDENTESFLKIYIASELPLQTISIEQVSKACKVGFYNLQQEYILTDNNYSELFQRESLTPYHYSVNNLWTKAYSSVWTANTLTGMIDEKLQISEEQKQIYTGLASYCRGATHFYLTMLYGSIPIVNQYSGGTPNQASEVEINNFILSELNQAIVSLPEAGRDSARLMKSLVLLKQNKKQEARQELEKILNSSSSQHINSLLSQTLLLLGDISLAEGNNIEAIQYINMLYEFINELPVLSLVSTTKEIEECIKTTFAKNNLDEGLKFLNKLRWEETLNWGKYILFPIPALEMTKNPHWTQNPGW